MEEQVTKNNFSIFNIYITFDIYFMRTCIFFLFSFLLSDIQFVQAQSISPHQIDSLVSATMDAMPLAGIAVAVVKDGRVVHSKGYGVTAVDDPSSVDDHTVFAIASNSKAFTSAALAILVDDGRLRWTDKVVDHIPEFRMYDPYVTANFNIQDLLTHRSGLGLGAGDLMFFPDGADFTIDDVLKSFQYQEPVSAFRTRYDYDNLLYLVAGEVVARVSGISWAEFVETRIMEPLGMDDSAPVYQQLEDRSNVAMPHDVQGNELIQLETYTKPNASLGAAGGIYASVHDLSRWMRMHLNRGMLEEESADRILSEASYAELWRPHTNVDFYLVPEDPYGSHFLAYGLGWVIRDRAGMVCVEHTGGLPGMLSRTILVPELDLGIVVLTNTAPGGYAFQSISQTILDAYLGVKGQDWIGTSGRQIREMEAEADSVTTHVWKTVEDHKSVDIDRSKYIGEYRDDWFGKIKIHEQNGELWFTTLRSPKLNGPMAYYKGNTFAIRWEYQDMNCDAFANFVLDTEGRAMKIKMEGISPTIDFSFDFHDLDLERVPE